MNNLNYEGVRSFRAGFFVPDASDVDSVLIPYYRDFEYLVDIGAMVELDTEY